MNDQLTKELIEQYEFKKDDTGDYIYGELCIDRDIYKIYLRDFHAAWTAHNKLTVDEFLALVKAFNIPKKPTIKTIPFTYETWNAAGRPNPCKDWVEYVPLRITTQPVESISFLDGTTVREANFTYLFSVSYTLPNGKPFGVEVLE